MVEYALLVGVLAIGLVASAQFLFGAQEARFSANATDLAEGPEYPGLSEPIVPGEIPVIAPITPDYGTLALVATSSTASGGSGNWRFEMSVSMSGADGELAVARITSGDEEGLERSCTLSFGSCQIAFGNEKYGEDVDVCVVRVGDESVTDLGVCRKVVRPS